MQEWLSSTLKLDAFETHYIGELYERYLVNTRNKTGALGVKRKTFSKELRIFFYKDILSQKVRFDYKGGPIVQGIGFVEKD